MKKYIIFTETEAGTQPNTAAQWNIPVADKNRATNGAQISIKLNETLHSIITKNHV
jgi:hypothetical protein